MEACRGDGMGVAVHSSPADRSGWRCCWRSLDGYELASGGQALADYGLFDDGGASVVTGRHLLKTGMPMGVPDEAVAMLNRCGIRCLVVGHTPHGTCPSVIKSRGADPEAPGLVVVMADTSYSDVKADDCRGRAVSEVQLLDDGRVRVQGVLPNGYELSYILEEGVGTADRQPSDTDLIGLEVPCEPVLATATESEGATASEGGRVRVSSGVNSPEVDEILRQGPFFVKALLDSSFYLLHHVDGFVNKYAYLRPNELKRVFKPPQTTATIGTVQADPTSRGGSRKQLAPDEAGAPLSRLDTAIHLLGSDELSGQGEGHAYALEAIKLQMDEGLLSAESSQASSIVHKAEVELLQSITSVHTTRSVDASKMLSICPTCSQPLRRGAAKPDEAGT